MNVNDSAPPLEGRTFDCVFGSFVPRLTFNPGDQLRVQATVGDTRIDETVKADVRLVRPELVVVSWTESSGNFIVQVQDHQAKTVHNYARLADGQLFCAAGDLRPVAV